jgi:hypothetical protein
VEGLLTELVRLDREPDDRLLVGVEDRERECPRADARERRERAHLERAAELEALREVLGEQARGGGRLAAREHLPRVTPLEREPATGVANRQALGAHPAVEGVVERRGRGADPARADLEVLRQRRARSGQVGPFGQEADEHGAAPVCHTRWYGSRHGGFSRRTS